MSAGRPSVRRRVVAGAVALAAVWILGVQAFLPREQAVAGPLDAVIALSAGVKTDGTIDQNGAIRLRKGIDIARTGRARLYTTRVKRDDPAVTSDAAQQRIVDSAGFRLEWTILDGYAQNTRDEAERLKRALGSGRIAVVTSRLHTRRACAAFERMGFTVTCVSSGVEHPLWWWPYNAVYESAALVKYRLKGWI